LLRRSAPRNDAGSWAFLAAAALAAALLLLLQDAALAQAARHPFAVGPAESGGAATGFSGLILAWQSKFHLQLQTAVKALKTDGGAFLPLAAASFAYGVFHAAGPGHGKAVLASYMIANETALKRGLLLAALAALLQGLVAILIVGVAAALFSATARQMTDTASMVEAASYVAIAALGARLAYVKARAFLDALREPASALAPARASAFACAWADDPAHAHGPDCGHSHAIDPARLGDGFRWPDALATVVAAGLRPCSGALLVLAFSLSQGVFLAGAGATLLMAAGTAITTGALAATAVFAKDAATRLARTRSRRATMIFRGAELAAALLVLAVGLVLLIGWGARSSGA
jgi:ABC-type nickel/cobalt efflux system permease component RcnA